MNYKVLILFLLINSIFITPLFDKMTNHIINNKSYILTQLNKIGTQLPTNANEILKSNIEYYKNTIFSNNTEFHNITDIYNNHKNAMEDDSIKKAQNELFELLSFIANSNYNDILTQLDLLYNEINNNYEKDLIKWLIDNIKHLSDDNYTSLEGIIEYMMNLAINEDNNNISDSLRVHDEFKQFLNIINEKYNNIDKLDEISNEESNTFNKHLHEYLHTSIINNKNANEMLTNKYNIKTKIKLSSFLDIDNDNEFKEGFHKRPIKNKHKHKINQTQSNSSKQMNKSSSNYKDNSKIENKNNDKLNTKKQTSSNSDKDQVKQNQVEIDNYLKEAEKTRSEEMKKESSIKLELKMKKEELKTMSIMLKPIVEAKKLIDKNILKKIKSEASSKINDSISKIKKENKEERDKEDNEKKLFDKNSKVKSCNPEEFDELSARIENKLNKQEEKENNENKKISKEIDQSFMNAGKSSDEASGSSFIKGIIQKFITKTTELVSKHVPSFLLKVCAPPGPLTFGCCPEAGFYPQQLYSMFTIDEKIDRFKSAANAYPLWLNKNNKENIDEASYYICAQGYLTVTESSLFNLCNSMSLIKPLPVNIAGMIPGDLPLCFWACLQAMIQCQVSLFEFPECAALINLETIIKSMLVIPHRLSLTMIFTQCTYIPFLIRWDLVPKWKGPNKPSENNESSSSSEDESKNINTNNDKNNIDCPEKVEPKENNNPFEDAIRELDPLNGEVLIDSIKKETQNEQLKENQEELEKQRLVDTKNNNLNETLSKFAVKNTNFDRPKIVYINYEIDGPNYDVNKITLKVKADNQQQLDEDYSNASADETRFLNKYDFYELRNYPFQEKRIRTSIENVYDPTGE